jgi:transcriptional regulator with XRE-family HTH domain
MELDNLQALFGETVRDIRKQKGIAQEKLANLAGIDRTYMSAIERGLKNPSLKVIFQISDGLGIKASELIVALEQKLSR